MSAQADWPIEHPEQGADLARARLAVLRSLEHPQDVGRVIAGLIIDEDKEALCYLLGAIQGAMDAGDRDLEAYLPVVEAGLVRLGAFE